MHLSRLLQSMLFILDDVSDQSISLFVLVLCLYVCPCMCLRMRTCMHACIYTRVSLSPNGIFRYLKCKNTEILELDNRCHEIDYPPKLAYPRGYSISSPIHPPPRKNTTDG